MNDKIKDIVVTIIFLFTIISLFLINVIKKDTDISIAERRKLATMPELTTKSLFDGTYFKKFDSYVTDQFVERDAFRKIKIDIELSTKGEYNNLYLKPFFIFKEIELFIFLLKLPSKDQPLKIELLKTSVNNVGKYISPFEWGLKKNSSLLPLNKFLTFIFSGVLHIQK